VFRIIRLIFATVATTDATPLNFRFRINPRAFNNKFKLGDDSSDSTNFCVIVVTYTMISRDKGWKMRVLNPSARRASLVFAVLSGLALGACTTTSSTPAPQVTAAPEPRGVSITPAGFRLPEGAGCSGEVARFRAIMKNDIETGHTTQSVFNQIEAEMQRAEAMCASGNAGGASAHVRATRARFGYPAG
jgi:hypothetical protein